MAEHSASAALANKAVTSRPTSALQILDRHIASLARELQTLRNDSFDLHVQALPQELQDAILAFTIAVKPAEDGAIHITTDYKPPIALQLNRKIRASFAGSYYGGDNIFQYLSPEAPITSAIALHGHFPLLTNIQVRPFILWLKSLKFGHRSLISNIRLGWQDCVTRHAATKREIPYLRYLAEARAAFYANTSIKDLCTVEVHNLLRPSRAVLGFRLRSDEGDEWYRTNPSVSFVEHVKAYHKSMDHVDD